MRILEKAVFFVCVLSFIAWFPNSGHGQDTETERIETVIQGASLLIDNKANGVFYGNPTISAREVLVKGEGQAPAIVQELKKLVASF